MRPAACSGLRAERNSDCRPRGSSSGVARADFNGDGFGDLAIGAPAEDVVVGTFIAPQAGQVSILYGSSTGLLDTGNQIFNQNSPNILESAEANDRFGDALAAGDFDGDGRSDLAIGAPGEDLGTITDAGAVNVLYGTAGGLSSARNQLFHQDTLGILDPAEAGDSFGESLAWGDFGRGSQGDLVIGVPLEDSVSSVANAGFVAVLYGSSSGLTTSGNQFFSQGGTGDAAGETGDTYGATLAAGNFGRSAETDLAVGAPLEDRGSFVDVGAVRVIYGSPNGLVTPGDQFLFQSGTITEFDQNDRFGSAFAAGDFDADSRADLAVGVPREDVGGDDNAGQVNILYGSSTGISARGQILTQDTTSVPGDTEGDDRFGEALAAANFGNGAAADLAVGSPGEDSSLSFSGLESSNVGSVTVLYGTGASLLTGTGSQSFHEDSDGVGGSRDAGDAFSSALTAWNFGAGAEADLAVGVPGEGVDGEDDAGSVNVLYGSSSGLRGPGSQRWTQNSPGLLDQSESGDRFGAALY
ncbi:MAG: FG-GAP repeat protein [Solirubrobacteraceae bacterium]